MKKIQDAEIKDQRVLLRVDYNVPMKDGKIESDKRIRESLPTIHYLIDNGAKEIIIITHLGKPDGKVVPAYSLWPIANKLAELLSINKRFNNPADEYKITDKISMLENLRFNKGEEKNDLEFTRFLASKASLYINDAFGTCHRAHASTAGVAQILPSFAGLLVQKEVAALENLLKAQEKPFTVILGGAKIADKLPVIKNLMSRADNFLIGGAIANTFLAARRHYLGKSLIEKDAFAEANKIWQNLMDETQRALYLPRDLVLSKSLGKAEDIQTIEIGDLMEDKYPDYAAVDIGPKTIKEFINVIKNSKTIFWNGNMGISEVEDFSNGTDEIARALRDLATENPDVQIVIGGGDTVTAFEQETNNQQLTTNNLFLSTGGGATLEFLAGKELPGLKVLGYY